MVVVNGIVVGEQEYSFARQSWEWFLLEQSRVLSLGEKQLKYTNLKFDEIDLIIDALRDQVFHLQSCIHLHKVELLRDTIIDKFYSTRVLIMTMTNELDCPVIKRRSLFIRQEELELTTI